MTASWSGEQLDRISGSGELQIASRRADGTLRSSVPIWVVCVDDGVYVRTWYRRTTGWFGHLIDLPQARIRVPGLETDVIIADVGREQAQPRFHPAPTGPPRSPHYVNPQPKHPYLVDRPSRGDHDWANEQRRDPMPLAVGTTGRSQPGWPGCLTLRLLIERAMNSPGGRPETLCRRAYAPGVPRRDRLLRPFHRSEDLRSRHHWCASPPCRCDPCG